MKYCLYIVTYGTSNGVHSCVVEYALKPHADEAYKALIDKKPASIAVYKMYGIYS